MDGCWRPVQYYLHLNDSQWPDTHDRIAGGFEPDHGRGEKVPAYGLHGILNQGSVPSRAVNKTAFGVILECDLDGFELAGA